MKRISFLFICLICCMATMAESWTDPETGYTWEYYYLEDGTVAIGGNNWVEGDLIIPSTINGYSVVCLGDNAFYNCTRLTSVIIPDAVTSIGYNTFGGCSALASITLPNSLKNVATYAFLGCDNIRKVVVDDVAAWCGIRFEDPQSNPMKSAHHLYNKNNIEFTDINIPNTISKISNFAFLGFSYLTSITIPNSVTDIGDSAFSGCSNLISCSIPESVVSIGNGAFEGCTKLSSLSIPNTTTYIGVRAFSDCSALSSIVIPNSINIIRDYAFWGCSNLNSCSIPESVESIGNNAFNGCNNLSSITIPSSVTNIGDNAFYGYLSEITMEGAPPTMGSNVVSESSIFLVTSEYEDAYRSASTWTAYADQVLCKSNNSVIVEIAANGTNSSLLTAVGENNMTNVVDLSIKGTIDSYDIMILRNKMVNLHYLDLSQASIVANDNYEYYTGYKTKDNVVGEYMFNGLRLIDLKLPANITEISDVAISNCASLKSITIPNSCTKIGNDAFRGCGNLKNVTLPERMEEIGNHAFDGCPIKEITIPEGIKTLKTFTFGEGGCILEHIQMPSTLEVMEGCVFGYGDNNLNELIIPTGVKRIEGSLGNNSIATSVHIPPMMEYIADGAFAGWSAMKDYYMYVVDPISVNMNSFANYTTATLHVPTQSYYNYFWNTQWSKFLSLVEFDEPYERFYINNDYTLTDDKRFDGEPDADFNENSGFIVEGSDNQVLNEVHVKGDGTDAASIIDDGNINISKLYYDISIQANYWYFFSFPFRVKCSDIVAPGFYALRYYDGQERANKGSGGWKDFTNEYLEPGVGYIFQCSAAGTLSIPVSNPEFNGQDKDSELAMYYAGNSQDASWNFIGNPWSSYFDINDCEYDSPLTIWNGSGYDAYRPGDDDYMLHPFQAFFTQKPEGNNGLHFGHDNRYTYQQGKKHQNHMRAKRMMKGINPDRLIINLTMSDGTNSDRTRVVFNAAKTDAYETGTDAAKFMTGNIPQIYSVGVANVRYAINERQQGEVKLGFNAPKAGTYTIAAMRMDMPMLLRDLETGTTISLTDKEYTFESKAGTFDDRFLLTVDNSATGIAQLNKETGVSVIGAGNGLYVSGLNGTFATIYNTSGAIVAQNVDNGFTPLATGIYIVKVNGKSAKVGVR